MLFGMIPPAAILIFGLVLGSGLLGGNQIPPLRWLGGVFSVIGSLALAIMIYLLWLPRLAYRDGYLLVYLSGTQPIRVPVDVVECFFLGQSASWLPTKDGKQVQAASVVVRLAETAKQWHDQQVKPAMGQWNDGYITIRGTWCEPLDATVIRRLNHHLAEVHRSRRQGKESVP